MSKATILLIAVISVLGASVGYSKRLGPAGPQLQNTEHERGDQRAMRLAIASVDPMLQATNHYRVGEQAIVTVSMVNSANQPCDVCASSDLYQDLPTLTKNGHLLPYSKWQTYLLGNVRLDQTCRNLDQPERILLKANEPTVVDFLTIADDTRNPTGALAWYDPLTPGTYELSIQRRLGCCDGPMIESNKISFEVGP